LIGTFIEFVGVGVLFEFEEIELFFE